MALWGVRDSSKRLLVADYSRVTGLDHALSGATATESGQLIKALALSVRNAARLKGVDS